MPCPGGAVGEQYLLQILETVEKDPVHCLNDLAFLLHRHISGFAQAYNSRKPEASGGLLMKNFIDDNLRIQLTMEDIARHAHFSVSWAIQLFKETYHVTPYHYYLSRRLEIAQNLLCSTNLPIQEISNQLGFADYRHFSNFFKRWNGISPTAFRSRYAK